VRHSVIIINGYLKKGYCVKTTVILAINTENEYYKKNIFKPLYVCKYKSQIIFISAACNKVIFRIRMNPCKYVH